MDGAKRGSDDGDFGYGGASLPELVEAATRSGKPKLASAALPRLEERHAPRARIGRSESWPAQGR
jgi:hypothetical protein